MWLKTLEELNPLFLILLGSLISFFGVIYSIRRQWECVENEHKRKIKVEYEESAIREARIRLQSVKEQYLYEIEEDCKEEIVSYNEWFFRAQPFLPSEFNDKWVGIRDSFVRLCQLQQRDQNGNSEKYKKLHEHINKLIGDCFIIIDSTLCVQKIVPEICSL
jgi:hypothetical protein